MATRIENAAFDTAAAAVAAGRYGPITREEAVSALDPNSDLPVKCKTNAASGLVVFYISYDDLAEDDLADRIIQQAVAPHHQMVGLKTAIAALNTAIGAYTPPYTRTQVSDTLSVLKNLGEIKGY